MVWNPELTIVHLALALASVPGLGLEGPDLGLGLESCISLKLKVRQLPTGLVRKMIFTH